MCDVEIVEDRLVEFLADFVARRDVERSDVSQEVEEDLDLLLTGVQIGGGRVELLFKGVALSCDFAQTVADAILRERSVGCEVEEVVLLRLQRCETVFELRASEVFGVGLVAERAFQVVADDLDELGAEFDALVVFFDRGFDVVDVRERCVTGAVLGAAAEEVPVLAAVTSDGALLDEPTVHVAFEAAMPAPEAALEVVRVDAASLVGDSAGVHRPLDVFEQVGTDEGLMASFEGLALVGDFAEVVPVTQHLLDLRVRDRPRGSTGGGARGEPTFGEFISDVLECVVVGCVELERESHERRPHGVDADGADFASFGAVDGVLVADRCAADGAAVLCLLRHLVGDVGAVLAGAVLVERGEDAVHELSDRGVVDLFCCGDEGDTALLQVGHDDGVVGAVAGEAGELVDDDVVDVAIAADAFEHLLERDALGHLRPRAAGFEVLADDRQAELVGFAGAGDPLGGDGDALGIVVGVDLTFR